MQKVKVIKGKYILVIIVIALSYFEFINKLLYLSLIIFVSFENQLHLKPNGFDILTNLIISVLNPRRLIHFRKRVTFECLNRRLLCEYKTDQIYFANPSEVYAFFFHMKYFSNVFFN